MRLRFVCRLFVILGLSHLIAGALAQAGGPISIRAEAPASVRFGDPLTVTITITNEGATPVTWPVNSMTIAGEQWSAPGMGGTGIGSDIQLNDLADPKRPIELAPGQSVKVEMVQTPLTSKRLGKVTAPYAIHWGDRQLDRLGKEVPSRSTVVFEAKPSMLMEAAWGAHTDVERAIVQQEINAKLRRLETDDSQLTRDAFEGLLNYLGAYSIPSRNSTASSQVRIDLTGRMALWKGTRMMQAIAVCRWPPKH
jgi:hypothetical protein